MALKVGTRAPDFSLPSTSGETFSLYKDQKGKPCILYFFPKDFTPGCEKEACDFRDRFDFFSKKEIDIYGISRDKIETHLKFRQHYELPFNLLSDKSGEVSKLYDASLVLLNISKRITYLLDKDQMIVAVYDNFFGAHLHIKRMMEKING